MIFNNVNNNNFTNVTMVSDNYKNVYSRIYLNLRRISSIK